MALLIECASIALEMKEIYYFSREMTIVDEFRELIGATVATLRRLTNTAAAPVSPEVRVTPAEGCDTAVPSGHVVPSGAAVLGRPAENTGSGSQSVTHVESMVSPSLSMLSPEELQSLRVHTESVVSRRSVMFSFMLLDLMVAEGIASVLSFATFYIYNYSFDKYATGIDHSTIIANGIVSVLSELILSDTIAIAFLSWKGELHSHLISIGFVFRSPGREGLL